MSKSGNLYKFGPFLLNASEYSLFKNQVPVLLKPKAFDILLYLLQKNGQMVEKDELMQAVWHDSYVSETNIAQKIYQIRKVLGDGPDGIPYIETIPCRGYRFSADVVVVIGTEGIFQHSSTQSLKENGVDDSSPDIEFSAEVIQEEKTENKQSITRSPILINHNHENQMWLKKSWIIRRRNLFVAFALLIIVVTFLVFWRSQADRRAMLDYQPKSIAILPFKSASENDGHNGLGMADALISKLGNQQKLQVKPTSAIIKYIDKEQNALDIGRHLGVDIVVEGFVQRSDNRIRVTIQVLDIRNERAVWSEKFDEPFTEIFYIQDAISERIAETLALKLNFNERKQLAKRQTDNIEAYHDYSVGIYFWNKRDIVSVEKAIQYLNQAIQKDANYAAAYAILADCYHHLAYKDDRKRFQELLDKAEQTVLKAISIDESISEAYAVLCHIKLARNDFAGAESSIKRAIELNPTSAMAHLRYGWVLLLTFNMGGAAQKMKQAQELDPVSPTINTSLCIILPYVRRFDESIKYCQRALDIDPNFSGARVSIAKAYIYKGMYEEAITECEKLKSEGNQASFSLLAYSYAVSGRQKEAKRLLTDILKGAEMGRSSSYNVALAYMGLGNKDKVFDWLNKAITKGDRSTTVAIHFDPFFDSIRSDPRFILLQQRK